MARKKKMKTIKLDNGNVVICDWDIYGKVAGWIDILAKEAKTLDKFGVLSPLILDENNKIIFSAGYISSNNGLPLFNGMGQDYYGQFPGLRECEVTSLKCAIISKDLLKELELPENAGEDIFTDADWCLQALAKGFKNYSTDQLQMKLERGGLARGKAADSMTNLEESYANFKRRWGGQIAATYRIPVVFSGTVAEPTGFAKCARNILRGLTENGCYVLYDNLMGIPEAEDYTNDELVNDIMQTVPNMQYPQITWGLAPLFFKNSGRYKIGFSLYESDPLPQEWIPYLNMMNEIWVASKFMKELYERNGVRVPVYVVPLGTDPAYFHPAIAPAEFDAPERWRFICNATWEPRKNLKNLILAFQAEFSIDDNVCLIIKTANMGLVDDIKTEVEAVNMRKGRAKVYIKEQILPDEAIGSLYTAADCYVSPSRGEGWGMPLHEALACGLPVITTGHGTVKEVLSDSKGKPLPGVHFTPYRSTAARTRYIYMADTKWADPSMPDLMRTMRHVYNNLEKEKTLALQTSEIIRSKYNWFNACKIMTDRIKDIYKKGAKNENS